MSGENLVLDGLRPWRPVDLADVLDGTWQPPQPSVGRRSDGVGLFYPGKVHSVASESEGGKTWLAVAACADEMAAGHTVVYLDFEDDVGGIVGRLLAMGVHRDVIRARFAYIRPTVPLGSGIHVQDLVTTLDHYQGPTLVILDGVTEAMTLHGLSPLDNSDVAKFAAMLPRKLADRGSAVVCLDHVPKDRENRGRYSLGAAHKLNGLDGAAYVLENRTPFGIGITGRSTIRIAKDRPAQLRRHALPSSSGLHWFGDLVVRSHDETFVEVSVEPPVERDDTWRPTVLMAKVAAALERAPEPLTGRGVTERVSGNAQKVRQALAFLVDDGYVVTEPGPRGSVLHRLVKPYRPEAA